MAELVTVAGATGHLGQWIVRALHARGFRVRAISRQAEKLQIFANLPGLETCVADCRDAQQAGRAVAGATMVISALGASVSMFSFRDRLGLADSDLRANCNLICEAEKAAVRQFLYVSTMHDDHTAELTYVRVHRQIEHQLGSSALSAVIIRPTGFYYALAQMTDMASFGCLPRIGDGQARTNPIDEQELAHFCVDAMLRGPGTYPVGGPQVLSRTDILRAVLAAAHKSPRLMPVPSAVIRAAAWLLTWLHPRLGHLLQFFAVVSTHDCLAPTFGRRTFSEYLQSQAGTY